MEITKEYTSIARTSKGSFSVKSILTESEFNTYTEDTYLFLNERWEKCSLVQTDRLTCDALCRSLNAKIGSMVRVDLSELFTEIKKIKAAAWADTCKKERNCEIVEAAAFICDWY